ncbi:murein hydrolase activator EnvC [Methylocapsa sp. S129]|uniref:murein hydrolase activator EnvC family protein n=1 Tax=Methylocapsa sp. S129 TaxID=1641869 RepID=UPI00131C68D9|nr:peptidoglycan DD-metalloendopeptidase family protein [Methylocapsa sp. S129]
MKIRGLSRGETLAASGRAGLAPSFAALAPSFAALALLILSGVAFPPCAFADPAPPAAKSDDKATQEMQLRGVEDTMRASEDQRRRIEADIETIRADRARLNAALIETTAKVQDTERQMDAANTRLTTLVGSENALRRSLESRRGVIADVLAVLQRMGRSPPPAILVRPQDMTQAIRAAMLLGSVLPDLKSETVALAQDLDELADLRKSIASERESLGQRAESLAKDKERLTALVVARQQSLADAEQALGSERDRAAELARQAANLKELIARMESEIAPAKAEAAASHAADEAAAADVETRASAAKTKDPARLRPALAFADARGQLALPAAGTILKAFGAPDAFGRGAETGVSIATPAAATVASPIDGWVAFSGPYRTYGQLLIINAGGGYYMVLAGMDRINVGVGQFVLAGEPVASMGDGSARTAAAAAIGAAQPILYIEVRKDGAAIDPGPWWAKTDIEKARG